MLKPGRCSDMLIKILCRTTILSRFIRWQACIVEAGHSAGPEPIKDNVPVALQTIVRVIAIHKHEVNLARQVRQSILAIGSDKFNFGSSPLSSQVAVSDLHQSLTPVIGVHTIEFSINSHSLGDHGRSHSHEGTDLNCRPQARRVFRKAGPFNLTGLAHGLNEACAMEQIVGSWPVLNDCLEYHTD